MSSIATASGEWLNKPQMIRYSFDFYNEISRLMGAHTFFMTNGQYERAFSVMHQTNLHILHDSHMRIFESAKNAENKTDTRDTKAFRQFLWLLKRFNSLYGTGRKLDNYPSFLELKPREKPKPAEDKVWVSAYYRFFDAWGQYDYEYIIHRVKYVVVINGTNAAGFPTQTEKPLVSFTNPNQNIMKLRTNVLPYGIWDRENRIVRVELQGPTKQLEHMYADYLHREQGQKQSEESTGPQIFTVGINEQRDTDSGGYDHGPLLPPDEGD